jgi:hypothetical protein
LLIMSGEKDHTVPWAIANASYQQQQDNQGVTEIVEMKDRRCLADLSHQVGLPSDCWNSSFSRAPAPAAAPRSRARPGD